MRSVRFDRAVILTDHAKRRMVERGIDVSLLQSLLEHGELRARDGRRFWLAQHFSERSDSLICAAVVKEGDLLVVKTVMHHFVWSDPL